MNPEYLRAKEPLFTDHATELLQRATAHAKSRGCMTPEAVDILVELKSCQLTCANHICKQLGIDLDTLQKVLKSLSDRAMGTSATLEGRGIAEQANIYADYFNSKFIGSEHLLLAAVLVGGPHVRLALEKVRGQGANLVNEIEMLIWEVHAPFRRTPGISGR